MQTDKYLVEDYSRLLDTLLILFIVFMPLLHILLPLPFVLVRIVVVRLTLYQLFLEHTSSHPSNLGSYTSFITLQPFVAVPSFTVIEWQQHILPRSSGIIIGSFRVHLGSSVRFHSRSLAHNQWCLASYLVEVECFTLYYRCLLYTSPSPRDS